MEFEDLIRATPVPRTVRSLVADLRRLGVRPGRHLLVHCSLSSLGWVCGGSQAVVEALQQAVGPQGSVTMPAHTAQFSDPADWIAPPVPETWWQVIRDTMPVFDKASSPTSGMGAVAELFRTCPGVLRSAHPLVSFATWGFEAEQILASDRLGDALGESSPLARLYDRDATVLFLGTGYDTCTCFHLGEIRAGASQRLDFGAPVLENGERVWKDYEDWSFDTAEFFEIGRSFESTHEVASGQVGSAQCRLFSIRAAVDFAKAYLSGHK